MASESRKCKHCHTFFDPKGGRDSYCENCRPWRRWRRQVIAVTNFPVHNGEGCFEELVLQDEKETLPSTDVELDVNLESDGQILQGKSLLVLRVLDNDWIDRRIERSEITDVLWNMIAPSDHTDKPRIIRFSVHNRIVGRIRLFDHPRGVLIGQLQYDDCAIKYKDAYALVSYAIMESFRQGFQGKVLARPDVQLAGLYHEIGFRPDENGTLLELTPEAAVRVLFDGYGVSPEVFRKRYQKDIDRSNDDIEWIMDHLPADSSGRRSPSRQNWWVGSLMTRLQEYRNPLKPRPIDIQSTPSQKGES